MTSRVQRTVETKLALLRQHDDGAPWTRISAESGVPVRTLARWSTQFRADPTFSRVGGSPPGRRTRRIAPELVEAIEALARSH
ncbi:helix-turn-helix domain-containing protein [Glaciihabitans sp. UYNi722]|uniref:helix-turn-helix domain-containing protein n=1 Tax=Glaciihabitans sp. UYNi722 TaxID=3156344 RepID=UPI0033961157